jgi:hypothetical protein
MNTLTYFFFWGYALMLIAIGASGVFIARQELQIIFSVPLDQMSHVAQATLLNQYRFLKTLELAFGFFCMTYRHEIFQNSIAQKVFLVGVFVGVAGRLGSWWFDGEPKTIFLVFAALEFITGLLVCNAGRRTQGVTV